MSMDPLSVVNLLVSFSAWAELVWRYLLEVTNTVNPSSIPGSTLKIVLTLTLTLTLMYETLKAHCDVHVPRVQEHPRGARQNRPSRRERKAKDLENSLKQMCKKAVRDGESMHERKQLSCKWRNAAKARRKLRIERELKEKARK